VKLSHMALSILAVLALATILFSKGCSTVPAGYRGVIVNLYGSGKGVAEEPVSVGRYFLGWNKELYLFPTFLQNYTWIRNGSQDESITMQTAEGLSINTDAGITYSINPDNVVKVFQKYRLGIDEITNTFLRNMVRDAMNKISSTMTVEEIYGFKKEEFITKVNEIVKHEAEIDGIDVDKIYLIGSFNLPETVVQSINAKIQATQNAMKVENEVATAKAEAQKVLIEAQARAQANKIISASLTPELVNYNAIQKWDGQLPKVTSSSIPMINLQGGK